MFRVYSIIVAGLLLSHFALAAAGGVSPEEKQKQEEFRKAYGKACTDQDKAERIKALGLLEGLCHTTTVQILSTLVSTSTDQDKDVRLEAYKLLAKAPARDTFVSQTMAGLFDNLRQDDVTTRLDFGKQMATSPFKYFLVNSLANYCRAKLRYPDLITSLPVGRGNTFNNSDPNVTIRKQRAEFEEFLTIFNDVAKADLKATNKNSSQEVVNWWGQNNNKFMQADKELADKYKAEDQAKADKEKPETKK